MKRLKKNACILILFTLVLLLSVVSLAHADLGITAVVSVGNEPEGLAYDTAKGEIFVANAASTSISVISDSTNQVVATISLPSSVSSVVYDSAKAEVFAATYGTPAALYVISDVSNTVVATVPLAFSPMAIAYDSGKGEIFCANFDNASVSVISDSNNTVVATIPVGYNTAGIAYAAGSGEIFVTDLVIGDIHTQVPNSATIISDTTNTVITNVDVGYGDGGMVYDSGKGEVFVASSQNSTVSVISELDNTVVATIPVLNGPFYMTYDSGKGEVFVSSLNNEISIISDSNNTMISSINMTKPSGFTYDSAKGEVFVSNWYGATVSVISDSSTIPTPPTYSSPTPTANATQTVPPTLNPTPPPTSSSGSTSTVQATTVNGTPVNITINGNITSSQMSNILLTTNQNADTTTLSFTLTGQSGTLGSSTLAIPKNAVPYGTSAQIYIDGQPAKNPTYTQDTNNYYISYTTHFSTHKITITFVTPISQNHATTMQLSLTQAAYGAAIAIVAVIIVVFVLELVINRKQNDSS